MPAQAELGFKSKTASWRKLSLDSTHTCNHHWATRWRKLILDPTDLQIAPNPPIERIGQNMKPHAGTSRARIQEEDGLLAQAHLGSNTHAITCGCLMAQAQLGSNRHANGRIPNGRDAQKRCTWQLGSLHQAGSLQFCRKRISAAQALSSELERR